MSARACTNDSVGVLVGLTMPDGTVRWPMIQRGTVPWGIAPVAGHVADDHAVYHPDGDPDGDGDDPVLDEDASYRRAALAELQEEIGLTVPDSALELVTEAWRTNACRRSAVGAFVGHAWRVYRVQVPAPVQLTPSQRETQGVRLLTTDEVQDLADLTVLYATGQITDQSWRQAPGIEPVWCRWLTAAGLLDLNAEELQEIEDLIQARAWRGTTTGITCEITHRGSDGDQFLWCEFADFEALTQAQTWTRSDEADEIIIPISARLTPEGTDAPRTFRASRITIRELEHDEDLYDGPAAVQARRDEDARAARRTAPAS